MFPHPCCLNKENVFFYGFASEMITNDGNKEKKEKKKEARILGVWLPGNRVPALLGSVVPYRGMKGYTLLSSTDTLKPLEAYKGSCRAEGIVLHLLTGRKHVESRIEGVVGDTS